MRNWWQRRWQFSALINAMAVDAAGNVSGADIGNHRTHLANTSEEQVGNTRGRSPNRVRSATRRGPSAADVAAEPARTAWSIRDRLPRGLLWAGDRSDAPVRWRSGRGPSWRPAAAQAVAPDDLCCIAPSKQKPDHRQPRRSLVFRRISCISAVGERESFRIMSKQQAADDLGLTPRLVPLGTRLGAAPGPKRASARRPPRAGGRRRR